MNTNLNAPGSSAVDARRPIGTINGYAPSPKARALNGSLRVPVSGQNWAYLRALRHAELAAWNAPARPAGTAAAGKPLSLAQSVAQVSRGDLKERWLYSLVAVVAVAAVGYGLWSSLQLTAHWTSFVQFVGQIVG